jgi:hypothetical protein
LCPQRLNRCPRGKKFGKGVAIQCLYSRAARQPRSALRGVCKRNGRIVWSVTWHHS